MGSSQSLAEILDLVCPKLDIPSLLPELSPQKTHTGNWRIVCPECGKREAYMPGKYQNNIICNRGNKCGATITVFNYVMNNIANNDGKVALEILSENAGLRMSDNGSVDISPEDRKKALEILKEVQYDTFNKSKSFSNIKIADYLNGYENLSDSQKLKIVYSYIYRFSLTTNQDPKYNYYAKRGIQENTSYLKLIGFLSPEDIKTLSIGLKKYFPIEDLIRFNLLRELDATKRPGEFKFYSHKGFALCPSFDLYSNLITGFMLRNIGWTKYFSRNGKSIKNKSPKEFQVCNSSIEKPLPFALTNKALKDPLALFVVTEGHVDGLSLPATLVVDGEKRNLYPVSIPGINGFREQFFGLLKGKLVFLALDQDRAGQIGAFGWYSIKVLAKTPTLNSKGIRECKKHEIKIPLTQKKQLKRLISYFQRHNIHGKITVHRDGLMHKMQKAKINAFSLQWERVEGKDVNALKQANKVSKVFQKIIDKA